MKIHDISMTIHADMQVYGNNFNNSPKFKNVSSFETGRHYETAITMNMHNGTHIDAPKHMLEDGATMDVYAIERFVSRAKVLDLTHITGGITKADLLKLNIEKDDFILFKTKNSEDEVFNKEFIYLERSGAEYLCDIGITGVGTDSLGIERAQPEHETHKCLLGQGIMIVEGLRLKAIEPGEYQLIVLPLKILNAEGAPARAILIED